jgi:hypothetical protein
MDGHGCWSTMDRALHRSMTCGPSPCHFRIENKSEARKCQPLCKKAPVLIQYQAAVHKISRKSLVFENKFQISPSHFLEITNMSLKFFLPDLCNRNSDFSDSCAKFLRIIHSFI